MPRIVASSNSSPTFSMGRPDGANSLTAHPGLPGGQLAETHKSRVDHDVRQRRPRNLVVVPARAPGGVPFPLLMGLHAGVQSFGVATGFVGQRPLGGGPMLLPGFRSSPGATAVFKPPRSRMDCDGTPSYLPVADPFDPDAAARHHDPAIPAADITLLAPCRPRVVLGMAHNTDRPTGCWHRRRFTSRRTRLPRRATPSRSPRDTTRWTPRRRSPSSIGTSARNLNRDNASPRCSATRAPTMSPPALRRRRTACGRGQAQRTYTPLGPWIRTDLDPADLAIQLGDDTGLDLRQARPD